MEHHVNGELIPQGGGDSIPLTRSPLILGRRESCDICLQFPNVSSRHCEMLFLNGLWAIRDLHSTNGIKVNGVRIDPGKRKFLNPGDAVTIGKREFHIQYAPTDRMTHLRDTLEDEMEMEEEEDIMSKSLMEKAGLERPHHLEPARKAPRPGPEPESEPEPQLPPQHPVLADDADEAGNVTEDGED